MGHNKSLFGQRAPLGQAVDQAALSRLAPVQSTNALLSSSIKGGGATGIAQGISQGGQPLSGTGGGTLGQGVSGNPQPGTEGSDALSKSILDFVNAVQTQGTLSPRDVTAPEQFFQRGSSPGSVSLSDLLITLGPQQFKSFFPFSFSGTDDPRFQQLASGFEAGVKNRLTAGQGKSKGGLFGGGGQQLINKFADPRTQDTMAAFQNTFTLPFGNVPDFQTLFAGTGTTTGPDFPALAFLQPGFADQGVTLGDALKFLGRGGFGGVQAGREGTDTRAQQLGIPDNLDLSDPNVLNMSLADARALAETPEFIGGGG